LKKPFRKTEIDTKIERSNFENFIQMKQFKILGILAAGLVNLLTTSCKNQDVDFPDFDYSAVYFALTISVEGTIVLAMIL
jgi:hypothetical protein